MCGEVAVEVLAREGGNMSLSVLTESIFEFRRFLRRYQENFRRIRQRRHFEAYLRGLIGPLERKSIEPIALDQRVNWRSLQDFIGISPWDAEALLFTHRRHVRETLGSPNAILILDPTQIPKRGDKSVGVARQWCGNLGKEENCQNSIALCYAAEKGHTYLDRRLYLPDDWAWDERRRRAARVPKDVVFRTSWELGYEMISRARREGIPHAWVNGDEEFGKVPQFHDWLSEDGERYVFEVPRRARVWVTLPKRGRKGPKGISTRLRTLRAGRPRLMRVDELPKKLPRKAWIDREIRDASKGPLRVRSVLLRVRFHRRNTDARPEGWLLITETVDQQHQMKFFQSNGGVAISHLELLRAAFARWPIEQVHGQGKNETGLADYETRTWPGWHHHTALSFLAHLWLVLERNRLGEKIPRDDRRRGPSGVLRRFPNRTSSTPAPDPTDAASATTQSGSAALALEEGSEQARGSASPEKDRCWTGEIRDHSHGPVNPVQYH